ncbi:hypothetical protein JOC94_004189 [Bacillus thermophilus]|uniref:Uncharacterized protein n=1 Tax=Siminovitchia thermophila TaxID=1245522 RepID=A0ABS2RC43_9BACI|nr:hypothetical protein [Siminovitchia thermophila]MBM7717164.1 hypothetical protein [Siminovitchia thermophila]
MIVQLKYYDMDKEKGYSMWVRNKREVIEKLARVGASPADVFYLAIRKKGESDYKEYDPAILSK